MLNRRRWSSRWIASAVCLLLLSGGALAQSAADEDGVTLTLKDALRIALENNLELEAARVDPVIAAEQVLVNEAAFDGTLQVRADYDDSPQDLSIVNNVVNGAATPGFNNSKSVIGAVSWSDPLNFGGAYSVSFNPRASTREGQQATEFSFQQSTFEDSEAPLLLSYEMPLLRGFGRMVNTENLVLSRTDADKSLETFRGEAIRVIELAEGAYWDVVAARAALRTAQLALNRAEDLLALNRKKVDVGTLAPIEITQAEAGVASREGDVIGAEVGLRNGEDVLRRLLNFSIDDPIWSRAILTNDRPDFKPREIDLQEAIEVALQNRPEVINARRDLSKGELSAKVAKKNAWHELNLRANVEPKTGTSEQDIINTVLSGTQTIDTTTDSDGIRWSVGLTYSVPVRNRAARANKRISELQLRKAEIGLLNTEQSVRVDVRTAVRNLESGYELVEAQRKNVQLQNEKLDAEQKKFDNGMSTSFEVLTFQNDLAEAELGLIRAGLDYAKSLTAVERAKGTLLEARNLTIE